MGTYVWSYPFQVLNKLKTFCQIEQTPPPLTTTKKEKRKKKKCVVDPLKSLMSCVCIGVGGC